MTDWAPLLTRVRGEEVDAFTGYRLTMFEYLRGALKSTRFLEDQSKPAMYS